MTRRSLAHLTVLDTPLELVTVAADAGFRTIGIRLTATPSVGVPPYDILSDGPLLRETLRRLADTGVSVLDTEFLRFEPEISKGRLPGLPRGLGAARREERARDERRARRVADRRAVRRALRPRGRRTVLRGRPGVRRSTPASGPSPTRPTSSPDRSGRTRRC